MKKNKIMMYALALAIASCSFTGCDSKKNNGATEETKPSIVVGNKNLGQAKEQVEGVIDGVTYFPQTKKMLGADYSTVLFNAQLLDFDKEDFKVSDILKTLSAEIDADVYMDKSCSDFTFKGFRIARGNHTLGYIELFENGKLLEQKDFDVKKIDEYEFKGLFTDYIGNPDEEIKKDDPNVSTETTTIENEPVTTDFAIDETTVAENTEPVIAEPVEPSKYSRLLTFGNSIFCGNNRTGKGADGQGTGVTDTMSNGYSNKDKTITYYADENNFTIAVLYQKDVVLQVYFLKAD